MVWFVRIVKWWPLVPREYPQIPRSFPLWLAPSALQSDLVYLSCISWLASASHRPPAFLTPPHPHPLAAISLFLCLWVCFCFMNLFACAVFQPPHVSDIMWCYSVCLNSLSLIVCRPSHVAAKGIISLSLWLRNVPLYMSVLCSVANHIHTLAFHPLIFQQTFRMLPCLDCCN